MPRPVDTRRDARILALSRSGYSCRAIGVRLGIDTTTAYRGLKRARDAEAEQLKAARGEPKPKGPKLEPLFPIDPFTPQSACPHHKPIERGSAFCCMVCNRSGMDGHPALRRDPRTDPKPEKRPAVLPRKRLTRRERRSLLDRIEPSDNWGSHP